MDINALENEDGEMVPKIEDNKEKGTEKPKRSKEELAKACRDYYKWLAEVCPLEEFELKGKNGEVLNFYRGNIYMDEPERKCYWLRDKEYKHVKEKQTQQQLLGEEWTEDINKTFEPKAFISINTEKKWFNFGTEWDHQRKGYGRAIYDNYLNILEMLGVEDKEQYQLRVYGNPDHEFFQGMQTEQLIAKTEEEPDLEKGKQMLGEFAKYPYKMGFRDLNSVIQYAIKSGIPKEEITKAINENGFHISYGTINRRPKFEREDLEQFKSFNITGLKATAMHQHFIKNRSFGFIRLLGEIETQDASLEFRNILEEVKKDYEQRKIEERWIPDNLKEFGELEHIILDWDEVGLLLKNVNPEIKQIVKRQAINRFDEFDPKHEQEWRSTYNIDDMDINSRNTFKMLSQAGMMDKEAYIELYQKALNRNYNLKEFNYVIAPFIDEEEKRLAKEEIAQNVYYPAPKKDWQFSQFETKKRRQNHSWKVSIPQEIREIEDVRALIKSEILRQGVAKRTKIKTTMTGKDEKGKTIVVDNLKDWMFGVPGAHGNLRITKGNTAVVLPPQTPKFAVEVIEQTFRKFINPDYGER